MIFSRRQFTFFLLVLLAVTFSGPAKAAETDPENLPSDFPGFSIGDLRRFSDLVQRTGLGPDKIPAMNNPAYMSISDANLSMDDDEVVFVVHHRKDLVHIYPQRILVWHEVLNDNLPSGQAGQPPYLAGASGSTDEGDGYTITYCPLTGSVAAFRSMASKYPSTFGVSGNILNGNTVLYDRVSHSLWIQLMGVCIEGPFRGKRLERIPVLWANWGGVKERYAENGKVLSRSTGFRRSYGKDPYGSYQSPGTYYDDNRLPFPVSYLDPRLPPKTRILGLTADAASGAVIVDAVKEQKVLNFTLGVIPMVAIFDERLNGIRVFDRRLPDQSNPLSFIVVDDKLLDEQTRSEWKATGNCAYGRLREKELTEVIATPSMWFAWASFYRGTQIFPFKEF